MPNSERKKVGRPLKGERKRVRVSFTLPPDQVAWLHRQAAINHQSRSEILENAIQESQKVQRPRLNLDKSKGQRRYLQIPIPRKKIINFCHKYQIRKLSLFGSVLTNQFRPQSDIDVLVEFDPDHNMSLFEMISMERELNQLFGHKVDLKTPQELSRYFRDQVMEESEILYAA